MRWVSHAVTVVIAIGGVATGAVSLVSQAAHWLVHHRGKEPPGEG